jgi:hypothetical protein
VHFEDTLVQLEPNSVLDVNWDVDLDTNPSVDLGTEVECEPFVFISP